MNIECSKCKGLMVEQNLQLGYKQWELSFRCLICGSVISQEMYFNKKKIDMIRQEAERDRIRHTTYSRKQTPGKNKKKK